MLTRWCAHDTAAGAAGEATNIGIGLPETVPITEKRSARSSRFTEEVIATLMPPLMLTLIES